MTAVFLDFATVRSAELDISPLETALAYGSGAASRHEACLLEICDHTPAKQIIQRIGGCEFVFANKSRITREVITAAGNLQFIGLIATGVDNVDLEAAKENEVAVCNIRTYCTDSVVEHVFGVLLQLARSFGQYEQSVRRGDWQRARNFCMLDYPLRELATMTLGIVGYGELGKGVQRVAKAFGMQVLISERIGTDAQPSEGRVSFSEVLSDSDVVSLHCPLTADTKSMIGATELAMMKSDAILINTARGGLVDSAALVRALANGHIGGAAIDVLAQEPPIDGDPLLDYRGTNLIVTPHVAWATTNARQNAINEVAANVTAFLNGEFRNRVA